MDIRRTMVAEALASLSVREREVLRHLADGLTYTSIARRMDLSPHTIDTYLRRIREKSGARSRVHLLRLAIAAAEHHEQDQDQNRTTPPQA
ncbi:response regulator transcription factor [Streptomyces sp. NPDC090106]|uniref:response regulator transcription factor n=1 Tax=Streptomyces sp. NPDC090106 TaxID=3365946 RepID=UPI00381381B3